MYLGGKSMSATISLVGLAVVALQCGIGVQVVKVGVEEIQEKIRAIRKSDSSIASCDKGCLVETPAKRLDLLKDSFKAFGYGIKENENTCLAYLGEERILLEKTELGNYTALFIGEEDQEVAKKKVSDIYDHYTRLVQEKAYQTLLKRAKEKGYQLESESIGENQSIKLSFVVGE